MWKIIPLSILAIMASNTLDEIRYHWKRVFAHWFKDKPKLEKWFNPAISWNNKYWSDNKYIQWIFMSPLVFITDFWHFLKFVMLNCFYGILSLMMIEFGIFHMKWYWLILGMNVAWGIIYEFSYGVYGLLGDRIKIKE